MVTFGNIAATRGCCAKPAGGYWRRSMIYVDLLSVSVIERRRKSTHMVKNRIPDCHVAVCFRNASCLAFNNNEKLFKKKNIPTFDLIDRIPVHLRLRKMILIQLPI